MTPLGVLPRSGSNSSIVSLHGANGTWQHLNPSPGFKKPHIKSPTPGDSGFFSRLHRTITGRRVGMLSAALVSLFSFLMLINIASRLSVHFIPPSGLEVIKTLRTESNMEKIPELESEAAAKGVETLDIAYTSKIDVENSGTQGDEGKQLQMMSTGKIRSLESEVQSTQATTMATRVLSEGVKSKAHTVPEFNPPNHKNHSSLPRSLLSSDQPLPPGHPCQGFTLPPPPADKKRTGPRPCPVCYLPVEEAIEKMPAAMSLDVSTVRSLTYKVELPDFVPQEGLQGSHFGGHPSLEDRNNSFQVQEHMNVHCGFVRGVKPGVGTGFDIDAKDLADMDRCKGIVVASAIFGNYDLLQQPRNLNPYSRSTVCFFMFVDEETQKSLDEVKTDGYAKETGVWKVVVVRNMPYKDARRNGKIPKLLLHRLFPNARFSLWIDGKLQLAVDPYQVLERFLWRQNQTFAISQHYKRLDVFEEAEANKAAGKYDNSSIDAQVDFYRREGITHFDKLGSPFRSDVPEGCVIIREHTPVSNLFTCLWFNEVDRFTPRDQLSFAIVRNTLMEKASWGVNMFLDCERRNFVVQGYHKDVLEQKKSLLHSSSGQMRDPHKVLSIPSAASKEKGMVPSHARPIALTRKARKHRRGSVL
ncbi:hypothetical protein GOP47_0015625 [Adiantum capillus-veneris]|uniref:TOD1/MUCI70 glycosyltransferase-like domain-containing protein n=1 Tax=Adiantum capillus-veneris TaxID=13818 RepID=A0A9D4ZBU0_ADICA|nr:hypothetical protein GOP47_0015625 [Adiantum capillus-veneris]